MQEQPGLGQPTAPQEPQIAANAYVREHPAVAQKHAQITGQAELDKANTYKAGEMAGAEMAKANILQQLQSTAQHGFQAPTMREGLAQASEPQARVQKYAQGLIAGQVTPEQTMAELGPELGSAAMQMADQMMGQQAQQQSIPQEIGLGGPV